jgi:hypothetical protein
MEKVKKVSEDMVVERVVTAVYLWKTWKHGNGEKREWLTSCMLLENVEVPFAHYLIGNKIWWDPTHALCSA